MKNVLDQITKEAFEDELKKIAELTEERKEINKIVKNVRFPGAVGMLGGSAIGGGAGLGLAHIYNKFSPAAKLNRAALIMSALGVGGAAAGAIGGLVAGSNLGLAAGLKGFENRFERQHGKPIEIKVKDFIKNDQEEGQIEEYIKKRKLQALGLI